MRACAGSHDRLTTSRKRGASSSAPARVAGLAIPSRACTTVMWPEPSPSAEAIAGEALFNRDARWTPSGVPASLTALYRHDSSAEYLRQTGASAWVRIGPRARQWH